MNLLLFNIRTDEEDTALGFTTAWINALAARCERVHVVTMRAGRANVLHNVTVHSLEHDRRGSRVRRALAFYCIVGGILRRERIDVCFAHMTPLLAVLFAPLARLARVPVLLWYAHKSVTPALRMAERLVDGCVSSTPEGFRLPSSKVSFINQGIDTERFSPPIVRDQVYWQTVVAVGRVSAIKRLDELVTAFAIARGDGLDMHLEVIGGPITREDEAFAEALSTQVGELAHGDSIRLLGPIPYERVAEAYRRGWLFVSLSDSGSLDKALLEAMACGCIPLSRNDAFRALAAAEGLDELVPGRGAAGLAEGVAALAARRRAERLELSERLRGIVVREHGLDVLASRIYGHLEALVTR